jgi:hypothetical protein
VVRDAYNHVWTLTGRPERTRQEDDAVLREVRASADRAYASGDAEAARRHEARASELGEQPAGEDDRERLFQALETLPR